MSRKLTDFERRLLIDNIAKELCWRQWQDTGSFKAEARHIVDALTANGMSAATLKRAIDKLVAAGLREDVA